MKLKKIKSLTGKIKVLTGLHIGSGKDSVEIGGLDQPIIKDPISKAPYIPGSSLKGKMRSMLEILYFSEKLDRKKGTPCQCGKKGCLPCTLFGSSSDKKDKELGPTRLIVRDSALTEEFLEKQKDGELPLEIKYENTIHRLKGTAEHPRPLERVPAGVTFTLNLSMKIFEGDNEEELTHHLYKGLKLIELDALGGNGSRGCGQVKFTELSYDGSKLSDDHLDNIEL